MKVGGCTVAASHRPASAPLGRFGGGWQWKAGVQVSNFSRRRGTVLLSLVVAEVRVSWGR